MFFLPKINYLTVSVVRVMRKFIRDSPKNRQALSECSDAVMAISSRETDETSLQRKELYTKTGSTRTDIIIAGLK